MRARQPRPAQLSTETVIMDGGYNENISSLELKGGELIYGINYYLLEGSGGGYQSTKGYERYDGQALASSVALDYEAEDPEADRELQRDAILEVPGTGNVLGVHLYKGMLYAFRNANTDPTAYTDMYVESATGWSKIDLGEKLAFTTGAVAAIAVGETITGGTSAATGVVQKVVITSGTIAGGDAAGYILIEADTKTGTFQSETITGGTNSGTAAISADSVAQTITKDGEYQFANHNFYGTVGSEKMYFTNKVNKAMVYDGVAFDFIDNSGMGAADKPIGLSPHNDRLFLAYEGGSLQYSTVGDPMDWTTDAGELGVGKEITGLVQAVGNALVIFCNGGTRVLQGTADVDTWQLDYFSQKTGAYENTAHRMFGTILFMNNRGVSTLDAVQDFGDFKANTISQKIYKTLQDYKDYTTTATIHRELNQYRLWFRNGLGVVFSFRGTKFRGVTLLEFPDPVIVSASGRDENDNTVVYFASNTGGYVYKMESGTSFDGSNIEARMLTAYYHYRSPMDWKRFINAQMEVSCLSDLEIEYKFYYDYSGPELPKAASRTYDLIAGVDVWGEENWGTMVWSSGNLTNRMRIFIHGIASNMSIGFGVVSRIAEPHTVQNMTVAYERLRRQL